MQTRSPRYPIFEAIPWISITTTVLKPSTSRSNADSGSGHGQALPSKDNIGTLIGGNISTQEADLLDQRSADYNLQSNRKMFNQYFGTQCRDNQSDAALALDQTSQSR